jgi:radical SAM family uncharacterized protein/radical SAM-linked protein
MVQKSCNKKNRNNVLTSQVLSVERPGRYTDGELNVVKKSAQDVTVRIALAFPDLYDVGMSYHGFKILYERINAVERFAAERVFAPWADFEKIMREQEIPLLTLETSTPLAECDIIGFTLQHELTYTNVLNMIALAGLDVDSSGRTAPLPLIIAGGCGAFSPEPLAPFIDCFVLGDGEEVVLEILQVVEEFKRYGREEKSELLRTLARIPGIYIPDFYECAYDENGRIKQIVPRDPAAPSVIQKRTYDITSDLGSIRPVVPLLRIIHDRLTVEIKRGCSCGCRFCQPGMIHRPVRERPPEQIVEICRQGLAHTGYQDIGLLSLSSADYSCLGPLVNTLLGEFGPAQVGISLPSLRPSDFDVAVADAIQSVRKTGLTFAPEAGTERLRAVINKNFQQDDFVELCGRVFAKGWRTLKLYFMIGLPTETYEDLDGMVALIKTIEAKGRAVWRRRCTINVTIAPFVPKPHTPFQWEGQLSSEELCTRFEYVASRVRSRCVDVKSPSVEASVLEAALSRGDRRLAAVLKSAWELGCRFDSWSEHLDMEKWQRSFAMHALDPAWYASRSRDEHERFPWDHLDPLVDKAFLWRERERSLRGLQTPNCMMEGCRGCKVCRNAIQPVYASEEEPARTLVESPAPSIRPRRSADAAQKRIRFLFTKQGPLRFVSHLDLAKVVKHVLAMSPLVVAYTRGFNPQPRIQFAPPLVLGYESDGELLDVFFAKSYDPFEALELLNNHSVKGLRFLGAWSVFLSSPSLGSAVRAGSYTVIVPEKSLELSLSTVKQRIAAFKASKHATFRFNRQNKIVCRDLKKSIGDIHAGTSNGSVQFDMRVLLTAQDYVDPLTALSGVLGITLSLGNVEKVQRTHLEVT